VQQGGQGEAQGLQPRGGGQALGIVADRDAGQRDPVPAQGGQRRLGAEQRQAGGRPRSRSSANSARP